MSVSIFHITTQDNEPPDVRRHNSDTNGGQPISFSKILIFTSVPAVIEQNI